MKSKIKFILSFVVIFLVFMFINNTVFADSEKILGTEQETELLQLQESSKEDIAGYIERYGSVSYGWVAYILNGVRIYSIPFCFFGIVVGAIYQYVIGIRRLDVRDKGFALIVSFVTILLICQVLPLVFTIVVRGWRG